LHLEALALGLSRVYCFGKGVSEAEKSLTTYHLGRVISQCPEDLSKLANHEDSDSDNNLSAIENLLSKSFARLTFADAVKALMEKTGEFKSAADYGHVGSSTRTRVGASPTVRQYSRFCHRFPSQIPTVLLRRIESGTVC
uniref:O-fucosyltransferase family protein n=1 Tax=Macrostomum lignano TaxID=282301 RepID=A0A1I8F5Y2_9PLAT